MTFFSQARRTCGTTHFIRPCTILHATGFGLPPYFEDWLIRSQDIPSQQLGNPKNIATKPHHMHYRYNLCTSNREGETNIQYQTSHPHVHEASQLSDNNRMYHPSVKTNQLFLWINPVHHKRM